MQIGGYLIAVASWLAFRLKRDAQAVSYPIDERKVGHHQIRIKKVAVAESKVSHRLKIGFRHRAGCTGQLGRVVTEGTLSLG